MEPINKREYLRQLVEGKNKWTRSLTSEEKARGFPGWHQRGYLPHCDFSDLVQLVTFRLADSMPSSRRGEWEHLLLLENVREKRTRLEDYLDRGYGSCVLRNPAVAQLAVDALLYFHGTNCELLAWCVMPNHVHVLVHVWQTPLWKLVQRWKRYVAWRAGSNCERGPTRRGFWQREYWDTVMRGEEKRRAAIRYVEGNPVRAFLCAQPGDWPFSSAPLRDVYQRLIVPARPAAECKRDM